MSDKPEFSGWAYAKQSFSFLGAHVAAAAKASGLWLVLIIGAIVVGMPFFVWLAGNNVDFANFVASFEDPRALQLLVMVPMLILMVIGWPSVAVAWHRFVLRREQPSILPVWLASGGFYLLLSGAFYFVVWILPGAVIAYLYISMELKNSAAGGLLFFIWLPAFIALLGLSMRFSLKLPAVAVGDNSMTFARSWKETASIWPGMLWGTVVLTFPLYMATRAIDRASDRIGDDQFELALLLGAINIVAIFLGLLLYATFLSLTYQRTVGDTSATFD